MLVFRGMLQNLRGFPGLASEKTVTTFNYASCILLLMEEIQHHLRLIVYPIIDIVLCIPGGAGFLPSTVSYKLTYHYPFKRQF